ncbi:MAG: hypothetical protein PHW96_01280 [Candidatus Nanoarchaeia archaeon]|nr:hypothetical protein [Candidatus Nanoarchaeia archaeon]
MEDIENKNVDYFAMAEEYFKAKKYTSASFLYLKTLKIKMAEKTGVISDLEDFKHLSEASGYKFTEDEIKRIGVILNIVLEKGRVSKEDCEFSRKLVLRYV